MPLEQRSLVGLLQNFRIKIKEFGLSGIEDTSRKMKSIRAGILIDNLKLYPLGLSQFVCLGIALLGGANPQETADASFLKRKT
jgi:hypothetical protein